jgi:hypothetical protein
MVGIVSSLVTCSATLDGTISRHHRERAGVLHRVRIIEELRRTLAAPLDDVAAEAVLALRREADVRHHRDARAHDLLDLLRAAASRLRASRRVAPVSFMKRIAVCSASSGPGLVGTEGQIGDDERTLHGAHDGAAQRDQLVDS